MPVQPEANITFLVVDDQFNVRRMVVNFLRTHGYTKVIEGANGSQAFERLKAHGADFVICDWNMPVMNGVDFLRKVRADPDYHAIPFLMVTAEVAEDVVAEAIEEGVDDYIAKPFKADTLIGKINGILERKSKPTPLEALLQQGRSHLAQKRLPEAVGSFKAALELAPESPRANLALGEALEATGEDEKALAHYEAAAQKSNRFVKAHDRLASLYTRRGEDAKAIEHGKIAAKISPRNARRQLELGKSLLRTGDNEAAAKALGKASESASRDSELSSQVGELLLEAGMFEDAAKAFEHAVDADPQQVHLYNRLGIAYRRQKKFDMAIQQYLRALDVSPNDENLYFNMAVAHAEAAEYSLARKALSEAIRLKPDFTEARNLYQRLSKLG